MLKGINEYKSVDLAASVKTASPHQLISMLMRGGLEALAKTKGAIDRNDKAARSNQINKAISIIMELQSCLDIEKGGEVAAGLNDLYLYMTPRLIEANRESSIEKVDEVIKLLTDISEGWAAIPPEYHKQVD